MGQPRIRHDTARVCGGEHPHLARQDWPATLSECARAHDHGDCGGSNGSRVRLWKVEVQKLADETNLTIKVRHYPPGTSKWNKIEHRPFCHITQNWHGQPLTDHATIIDLIAATTTKTGFKVEAVLDTTVYEKGIKITNAEMKRLNIRGDAFHPESNYTVFPRSKS
jgi:hypothetical protein